MKFEYSVIDENNSDKFNVKHCATKIKVTALLE